MPHVDGASLRGTWTARGESRFAAPVAYVTAQVRQWTDTIARQVRPRAAAGHRGDDEARCLEDHFARAGDRHALERMERAWDRRDGGGMRSWEGR